MICLEKVYKSFDTPAGELPILRDTTLSIKPGAFVSLMGPSGSGKTTLMNLIAGLDHIDSGTLTVYDTDLSTLGRDELTRWRGAHVSFVFQQFHLLPQLTVRENIDLVIDLNQLTRRYETEEILEKVGLEGRGASYPSVLSGGEQQRVAVARAFVGDTPILLADEPTGNLDQVTAGRIMDLMVNLHQEVGNTIVMITHDSDTAQKAQHQYILHDHTIIPG